MKKEKPKIIFTTDSISRGGKERQLFILTKYLSSKDFNIIIITKRFAKESYIEEYGLNENQIKVYGDGSLLRKYRSFKKLIISEKPDMVISWDAETSMYALVLQRIRNFIFINSSIRHGIRLFKFSQLFRSLICRLSPYLISNSIAGFKANNLNLGKNHFLLYNGIEKKAFIMQCTFDKEEMKRNILSGFYKTKLTIYITVANLVPYKDYFTVLKALKLLSNKGYDFFYIIIGGGPMRKEIEGKIKNLDLEKHILLTGQIENVSDYLAVSDIMIHSSRGEGVSNAILEGMYSGLPVIATNVGGIPETVYPGSSMLFPYKDVNSLVDCFLKAPETFKNFNPEDPGYVQHLEKFSIKTMVNRFEDIIYSVINDSQIQS